MLARAINTLTILSTVAGLGAVVLMVAAGYCEPFGPPLLSIARDCHVKLDGRELYTATIHFYSPPVAGPYRGGIVGFSEDPNGPETTGLTLPGIYYRDIRWPAGRRIWTLSLNLLGVAILCSVLPIVWLGRNRRSFLAMRRRVE